MAIRSAIMLAAGAGARFWPYSVVRNKCAMPVANVPNVRRLAESLHEVGVNRLVVVLGERAGSVRAALLGLEPAPVYVEQPAEAGTAGAVLSGAQAIDDERFLVVYADTVTTTRNLEAVANGPGVHGTPAAALVDAIPTGEGSDWYGAQIVGDRVAHVVGHDADSDVRLCGVAALDRSILPYLEANPGYMKRVPVGGMPPAEPDLAQSLCDWGREIAAIRAVDFVVDMDKPWHALDANLRMSAHLTSQITESRIDPSARIHDGAEIHGLVVLGPNSEIGSRVVIEGNLIAGASTRIVNGAILRGANVVGDECRISDYCLVDRRTSIGSRCIAGHGAEIDGVMLDGSYLYHYCEISGLVGEAVDIGAATVCGTLRFDDGRAEHRVRGRRERPATEANATYFGDYSRTGVNVITMPGAKIGVYSCVGAGVVVYEDVPDRTLMLLKQETVSRPWGPERYGW